jgi:hypothetical protein
MTDPCQRIKGEREGREVRREEGKEVGWLVLAVLELELRALSVPGRCSTT